jgi:hypothetical protein
MAEVQAAPLPSAAAELLALRSSGRSVLLRGVDLQQALQPGWCNDNNHHELDWTYGRVVEPKDYLALSAAAARPKWMHLQPSGLLHQLSLADVRLLMRCSTSGILSGRRPAAEAEELSELESRLPVLDGCEYFIRLDQCSPKDSVWKAGPITRRSQVVDSLVSNFSAIRAA